MHEEKQGFSIQGACCWLPFWAAGTYITYMVTHLELALCFLSWYGCGQADSGGHILGACNVPTFKAMYVARHDQALRLVLKSIAKGDHGGNYTIADIGRAELIEDIGASAKRIPYGDHGCCRIHAWREQT